MTNRTIVVGLAGAFVGMTALLVIGGIVLHPIALALALPFGAVSYFLWYHATGRLHDQARRSAEAAGPTERQRARQRARAEANRERAYRAAGTDGGRGATGRRAGARGPGGARDPRDRAPTADRMTEREAYETLGLDRTADSEAVRRRYRERAKRLHPDGEDGDEEDFKELNEAYEVLKG
ncbi:MULTISPECIES: DnaJ domain-containing protein [Halorubrum]|uniref:Molecular chaperone DnaJ n=1 Tax=Halorubrum tropicale TaxID=1765655 RepID=A0A0M9AUJ0_9EURY|nr:MULTISPECIES: DnaJ domain-containing protein [Halorubrum]KOX98105.1 molecular chaperone DnaJ [Halorubrum tropicale]RLM50640.1 molecular chaperone DnaJ [Halorubrum sp. Atlit-28R]TKX40947.1 molecular chaperone DnaJ [Halorubrum sp. ARQ200]TKX47793.1 molecular chaperone DnaJ [Halorubrum sp. ASP121]TKX57754.1 molecular chaperone DnaJ [Halorubrum sp. ASP1]